MKKYSNITYMDVSHDTKIIISNILSSIYGLEDYHVCNVQTDNNQYRYRLYLVTQPNSISLLLLQMIKEQLKLKHPVDFVPVSNLQRDCDGNVDNNALIQLPCINETNIHKLQKEAKNLLGDSAEIKSITYKDNDPDYGFWHIPTIFPESKTTPKEANSKGGNSKLLNKEEKNKRALAWIKGDSIDTTKNNSATLQDALKNTAHSYPEKGIHFISEKGERSFINYSTLFNMARSVASGLKKEGIKPEQPVIILSRDTQSLLIAFWGGMVGGYRPVIVSPGNDYDSNSGEVEKFWHCWNILDTPPILCCDTLENSLQKVKHRKIDHILSIKKLKENIPINDTSVIDPTSIAFYQLTSGSTGQSKCIEERHSAVINHIHAITQFCGFLNEDVSLNWLPFDHVGPLIAYHLRDTFLGRQQIHVNSGWILSKPIRWLKLMSEFQVTDSWSPNFGYKLLLGALEKERKIVLNPPLNLKRLMNGGEPINKDTVQQLGSWLSKWETNIHVIQPSFGMAETATCITFENLFNLNESIVSLAQLQEGDDENQFCISLGRVIPGAEIRIVNEQNNILPENVKGRIQFKGPMVTTGYHANPVLNPDVNKNIFANDGWFDSGDIGVIYKSRLFVTGRDKEIIIINGVNYSCHELESSIEKIDGIKLTYVAAVGWLSAEGERFSIVFVPDNNSFFPCDNSKLDICREVADTCRKAYEKLNREFGINPTHVVPLSQSEFLKTTSGKIQRKKMCDALLSGKYLIQQQIVDKINDYQYTPVILTQSVWKRCNINHDKTIQGRILYISDCNKLLNDISVLMKHSLNTISIDRFLNTQDSKFNVVDISLVVHLSNSIDLHDLIKLGNKLQNIQSSFEQTHSLLWVSQYNQIENFSDKKNHQTNGIHTWLRNLSKLCHRWSFRFIELDENTCMEDIIENELSNLTGREISYRNGKRYNLTFHSINHPKPAIASLSNLTKNGYYIIISLYHKFSEHLATELLENNFCVIHIGLSKISILQNNKNYIGRYVHVTPDLSNINLSIKNIVNIHIEFNKSLNGIFYLHDNENYDLYSNFYGKGLLLSKNIYSIVIDFINRIKNEVKTIITPLLVICSSADVFLDNSCRIFKINDMPTSNQKHGDTTLQEWKTYFIGWRDWNDKNETKKINKEETISNSSTYKIINTHKLKLLRLTLSQNPGIYCIGIPCNNHMPWQRYISDPQDPQPAWKLSVEANTNPEKETWKDIYGHKMPVFWIKNTDKDNKNYKTLLSDTETRILNTWENVLKKTIRNPSLSFFELGGDSILFLQMFYLLQDEFNRDDIEISELYSYSRLEEMGNLFSKQNKKTHNKNINSNKIITRNIKTNMKTKVSFLQKQICIDVDKGFGNLAWTQTQLFTLSGNINLCALKNSVQALVDRHDSLRIGIEKHNGEYYICDDKHPKANLSVIDLIKNETTNEELLSIAKNEFQSPMDIYKYPLFKTNIYKIRKNKHFMAIKIHHLVIDAWSMVIFKKELNKLYKSFCLNKKCELEKIRLRYSDFSNWKENVTEYEVYRNQFSYWKESMINFPFGQKFPLNDEDIKFSDYKDISVTTSLSTHTIYRIKEYCSNKSITLYTFFMSVYHISIHCYSDLNELIVCALTYGRNKKELQQLIGLYKDAELIKSHINKFDTLDCAVSQIVQNIFSAQRNSDIGVGALIEKNIINLRNEDLLLMLNYVDMNEDNLVLHDLKVETYNLNISEFMHAHENIRHLYLTVSIKESNIFLNFLVSNLFLKRENIDKIVSYYKNVIENLLTNPQKTVNQIKMNLSK